MMHFAVSMGSVALITLLLDLGDVPDRTNAFGIAPLVWMRMRNGGFGFGFGFRFLTWFGFLFGFSFGFGFFVFSRG
jgi:hypothetical protein